MKKCIAFMAGILFFAGSLIAEGYVNANDLETGTVKSKVELEDGFALIGTEEKSLTIDNTEVPAAPDGEVFTKRINLKGAGTADYRTVTFPVKSGEKVTVYALSGSKTDVRTLLFVNENGEQVASVDVPPYTGGKIEIGSFKASANGTLLAYSKSGGIYIYCIKVE